MAPFPNEHPAPVAPVTRKNESGCLFWLTIGCATLLVLFLAFAGVLVFIVEGSIKSTDAYKTARARATTDPRVVALLGSPVEAAWYATGNVNVNGANGSANIAFPIKGPKGKAKGDAEATRDANGWTFLKLVVHPERGHDIDLLHP